MTTNISSFLNEIVKEKVIQPKIYSKKIISNQTREKLLQYQISHVARLIDILVKNHFALDGSDTGIGKTYIALAVCKELGRRPIIICPKTIMSNWFSICHYLKIKPYDIVNYETIKTGKTYTNYQFKNRKQSPFIELIDPDPNDPFRSIFQWKLPKDAIIIIDETHRCKSPNTENGKLLLSVKQAIEQKIPVLFLSATICEKFTDMKILFFLFGLINHTRNFHHHIGTLKLKYPQYRVKRSDYPKVSDLKMARDNNQAKMIYEEIKDFTSRIRIKDLGDKFPSNQICCQLFNAEGSDKISEAYEKIAIHMKALREKPGKNHLAKIQKLKQEIELRKVPIFIEQAQLFLDDGKSVIIFINYLDTLNVLSEELDIHCKIHGRQTLEEREQAVKLFQSNQEKIIICQIRAGGIGISLHDLYGGHSRATLLNFPDSAADLLQALGRAHRAGAKSPVIQRIIFVANVDYEKKIMQSINRKLMNISLINDKDMDGHKYQMKKITRKVIKKEIINEIDSEKIDTKQNSDIIYDI